MGRKKSEKLEENLTEQEVSVEKQELESPSVPDGVPMEPIVEAQSYSDDAKRFSDKFGDKSALDVILELDKKVEELWKRIF